MARIIVIDDEADLRGILRLMLEARGHQVDEAATGSEGLRAIRGQTYDLVITDVLMPEDDGVAVAKQVPGIQPGIKVLAISGGGPSMPADWSLKLMEMFGVDAALHKPFEEDELIGVVDQLLTA